MTSFNVSVDSSTLKKWLDEAIAHFPSAISKAINSTVAYGIREIKSSWPRRSGNSANSFKGKKTSPYEYKISSDSPAVAAIEFGANAHTVVPRRAKMLTIPIRNNVVTKGGQISKPALSKLFAMLKNRKGRSTREIYESAGIVLAKKANIPALPARKIIENQVVPKISNQFEKNIYSEIDRVL